MLHRVPALPAVHTEGQEVLLAWAGGQPASEVAFVFVREVGLENLLRQVARNLNRGFVRTGECTEVNK